MFRKGRLVNMEFPQSLSQVMCPLGANSKKYKYESQNVKNEMSQKRKTTAVTPGSKQ